MHKIRVSAVSYLNTLPMVYGLKNSDVIEMTDLSVDTPAECAKKLISGNADIGLVPVVVIPEIKGANIISNFCIGADGPVRSVVLASQVELDKISTIVLDPNSRTSVILIKVLAENFWNKKFNYIDGKQGFEQTDIEGTTAGVVIGDKVFTIEEKYNNIIDLAVVWKSFTGLPFVFAAWVANKPIDIKYIEAFDNALGFGINNIDKAVESLETKTFLDKPELVNYLKINIDYFLDDKKKKAINLFLEKANYLTDIKGCFRI